MKRKVFYSFHYEEDAWRAGQIRNIGVVDGSKLANDNEWEEVKKAGNTAILKWINNQLDGCSCTIVLISAETASREWIKYEIKKSWSDGKGILGIYIHNLKNQEGRKATRGCNPFEYIHLENGDKLSKYVKAYNPPYLITTDVYNYISENISHWIEDAIRSRK